MQEQLEQAENDNPDKKQKWEEQMKKIEGITDGLGKTIDENIKETVAALNLLGINTVGSCDGHFDRGHVSPWVNIESDEAIRLAKTARELELADRTAELKGVADEIINLNLLERGKLVDYLEEFYANRQTPYIKRLVIQPMHWGKGRIASQGSYFWDAQDKETRSKNLPEYQEEMHDFTQFLKEKYFGKR